MKKKNKRKVSLEQSQNNQSEVGEAASNPEISGPSENLREGAFEATDEESDEEEPA